MVSLFSRILYCEKMLEEGHNVDKGCWTCQKHRRMPNIKENAPHGEICLFRMRIPKKNTTEPFSKAQLQHVLCYLAVECIDWSSSLVHSHTHSTLVKFSTDMVIPVSQNYFISLFYEIGLVLFCHQLILRLRFICSTCQHNAIAWGVCFAFHMQTHCKMIFLVLDL